MRIFQPRPQRRLSQLLAFAATIAFSCSIASAQPRLGAVLFVDGLIQPVGFVQDPGLPNVQYVVQQNGVIRVVESGALRTQNFLDLSGVVLNEGEQGLLGLALAPDFPESGRLYVNFVDKNGDTVVARFLRSTSDPLQADLGSRFDLRWVGEPGAFIDQPPFPNHKGGNIAFGPDGNLYIGLGDGGSGNDPFHNAQNPASLLGKMLRIDVNVALTDPFGYQIPPGQPTFPVAAVRPEIWAFGLRNPWKFTFDRPSMGGTGALIIGDVGQAAFEEIDYEPAGAGGKNYGWRNFEGVNPNPDPNAATSQPLAFTPPTAPIYEYAREGGSAVIGGYVYRGPSLGAFFADIIKNLIWSVGLSIDSNGEATVTDLLEHTGQIGGGPVSSFGTDSTGELYVVYYSGAIVRVQLAPPGTGGCSTLRPAPDWACVNGGWVPPGHPLFPDGAPPPSPPPGPPAPPAGCPSAQPAPDWACVDGGWVPPGHPLFPGGTPPTPPAPPPGPPGPPAPPTSCPTIQPAPDWVCVSGGWVPPGHPLAGGGTPPAPPPSGPPPPIACTTPQPGPTWACVSGGWVPPGHPLFPGGGS
jgi:glucose/arabinose dehydrogenase